MTSAACTKFDVDPEGLAFAAGLAGSVVVEAGPCPPGQRLVGKLVFPKMALPGVDFVAYGPVIH